MILKTDQPKILVVGSSSIDLVLNTEHHPKPGDTVLAQKSESFFGGKGANQAVAAARLGASVYLVGCVGQDPLGQQVLRNLVTEGVNVGYVFESENSATGAAYVTAANGKNSIVVVPAANLDLSPRHLDEAERVFLNSDIVLIQLEIPMDTVNYAAQLAKKHGRKLGIYAAPAKKISPEILEYASFIVVKSNELPSIFGEVDRNDVLRSFSNKLFLREQNSVVYHDGERLCITQVTDAAQVHEMGMGDAFTAGFAVALCHGNSTRSCAEFGSYISRKVGEDRGSQSGLPYLRDIVAEEII